MSARAVDKSKSKRANFCYGISEVEFKSQVDVNSTHGGLGAYP